MRVSKEKGGREEKLKENKWRILYLTREIFPQQLGLLIHYDKYRKVIAFALVVDYLYNK